MGTINDGGPAFPFNELNHDGTLYAQNSGATLRDYFATKSIPFVADFASIDGRPATFDGIADAAYAMADAMLKAREAR